MPKVAVVTGSRAEYGLLYWILKEMEQTEAIELQLIVTGMHLAPEFGMTINTILEDGFKVAGKIDMQLSSASGQGIARSTGIGIIGLAEAFERLKPDILLILGDRYEIFAAASAAMCMGIPIAHISGGESTEGAIDEQIRHAITKMAHIHFPANDFYANRIHKMGEESWRIFCVGDPAIENISKAALLSCEELSELLGMDLSKETILITYHPVTNERDSLKYQMDELLGVLNKFSCQKVFTYPNADEGSSYIISRIVDFASGDRNSKVFKNLGMTNYLSMLKHAKAVVGNSSSGIVEAPSFCIPVVNIGNRQQGRLQASNIIDCTNEADSIEKALWKALYDESFIKSLKDTVNPYGGGNTSKQIVRILAGIEYDKKLLVKKLAYEDDFK